MKDPALDQFITFQLLRLTNQLSRQSVHILARNTELRLPEWRCLAIIDAYGPQQVNQIANRLSADKGQISRSLASLEKAGYLNLARGARDRRQVTASLTEAGKAEIDRIMPILRRRQECLLGAITKQEYELLLRIIAKLRKASETFEAELVLDEAR